jgi:GntR family transcriptional regulator
VKCTITLDTLELRINFSSGVPIYVQLMEQIKHAVETGAVRAGEQLPAIRKVAEDLAMNPNTVVRAYRELERDGILELRHGSGAYVSATRTTAAKTAALERASGILSEALEEVAALGLTEAETRRVFESEFAQERERGRTTRRRT